MYGHESQALVNETLLPFFYLSLENSFLRKARWLRSGCGQIGHTHLSSIFFSPPYTSFSFCPIFLYLKKEIHKNKSLSFKIVSVSLSCSFITSLGILA